MGLELGLLLKKQFGNQWCEVGRRSLESGWDLPGVVEGDQRRLGPEPCRPARHEAWQHLLVWFWPWPHFQLLFYLPQTCSEIENSVSLIDTKSKSNCIKEKTVTKNLSIQSHVKCGSLQYQFKHCISLHPLIASFTR